MSNYAFTHEGKVFTPDGASSIIPDSAREHNAAVEARELALWASVPDQMLGYYAFPMEKGMPYRAKFYPLGGVVTTWLGTMIGHVASAKVYRHNFGGRMVSMTVRGTNGAVYYGRASWDSGQCITLHKRKA